jgi:beta-N-acetylhexosaminidase
MRFVAAGLALGVLTLSACTASGGGSTTTAPPASTPTASAPVGPPPPTGPTSRPVPSTPARSPAASAAQRAFDGMSLRQRVGQLLMVDCPTTGVPAATVAAITDDHVGSVILDGTSTAGRSATKAVTTRLDGLAPAGIGLFVATDQEGGEVQRLQGAGFARMPSAVVQGGYAPATLQADAQRWGADLVNAGVDVNLAPVLDTVPAGFGPNPPIGDLDRQYGSTPDAVTAHGLAFARGMAAAGVDVTVKHFPGLGRVHGNTDLTSGVTDSVTTRHDADLAPFRAAVAANVPFVMMSTASYARIDPGTPAAFSRTIVTGMLRGDLGFRGLIISDDLGGAKQVSGYPVGERAVDFVAAGGDIVLTVNAGQAAAMTDALYQRAGTDPAFRKQVDAAALLVLQGKAARGLLG